MHLANDRSIRQEVSCKRGVLKNFAKFTGKHMCRSCFLNKTAGFRPAILLQKSFRNRCFPLNFVRFLRSPIFYRTPQVAAIEMTSLRVIPLRIIILCCDRHYRPAVDLSLLEKKHSGNLLWQSCFIVNPIAGVLKEIVWNLSELLYFQSSSWQLSLIGYI